jgi:hypothetical protein
LAWTRRRRRSSRRPITVVGLELAALFFAYQVRRFRRAATVVPELYEGQSPDMPGW